MISRPVKYLWIALAAIASPAAAQLQFEELGVRHLPFDSDQSHAVAIGDVDGDGDLDAVWGNEGQNRLYLNDGAGVFTDVTAARMPIAVDATTAVALGDVDGDGDLDLAIANSGFRQNRLYLNDGAGTFSDATAASLPAFIDDSQGLAMFDLDADGDLDLVFANQPNSHGNFGQNRLYVNLGGGSFVDGTSARLPVDNDYSYTVEAADLDGDGLPDLMFGNAGQERLYLNNGAGGFADATTTHMPPVSGQTFGLAFGDVDGDGDLDAALGNGGIPEQNRLLLNDGSGRFTDVTLARLPAGMDRTADVALGDVDGDGDLDLAAGNGETFSAEQNRLYLNDGTGTFTDATAAAMPADNDWTAAAALADLDGDGDLDLLFGNKGQGNRLYSNGGGVFEDASARPVPTDNAVAGGVLLVDVDGDGDADLVAGNGGRQNVLYRNDGDGRFTDATAAAMPPDSERTEAMAAGDVDGDGDLDLVVANSPAPIVLPGQNRLYRNDGSGVFTDVTSTTMPGLTDRSEGVALGDVDGDGDLDLVFANTFSPNRLHLNDGTGVFTNALPARMTNAGDSMGVAMGDVDGDGDLDLVFANFGQANGLFLNDGSGNFTDSPARMPAVASWTMAVALVDVDGDGDLDMAFANRDRGPSTDPRNRLYLNDGSGTFTDVTAARMPVDGEASLSVVAGDVDGDGDPDLVFGNAPATGNTTGQNLLYVNDGSGRFADATAARMPFDDDPTYGLALADVDGDGDLDLWLGNGGPDRLYQNLQRHMDTPFLVAPGRRFRLDLHARNAPAGVTSAAWPFLSWGRARIPVPPLGTIGIDPSLWFPLPFVTIPPGSGTASLTATFPNIPQLAGISIHGQALLLQLPAAFLTNVTSDRIVR